jgi:hypothetical protein
MGAIGDCYRVMIEAVWSRMQVEYSTPDDGEPPASSPPKT